MAAVAGVIRVRLLLSAITLLFVSVIAIAAVQKDFTAMDISFRSDNETQNSVVITSHLISIQSNSVTSQQMIDSIKSGAIPTKQIQDFYGVKPVVGANISFYFETTDRNVSLCDNKTTNQNGDAFCKAAISSFGCGSIISSFKGNSSLVESRASTVYCVSQTPPFGQLVDASWALVFIVLGVLAAAMYASGRRPLSAFDVTTPKYKGPPSPKSFKFSTPLFGLPSTSKMLAGIALSRSLKTTLKTAEKYMEPKEYNEMVKSLPAEKDKRALLIAYVLKQSGVYSKLSRKFLSTRKSIKDLQEKRKSAKSADERSELDSKITQASSAIKQYESDFRSLSPANLPHGRAVTVLTGQQVRSLASLGDKSLLAASLSLIGRPGSDKADIYSNASSSISSSVDSNLKDYPDVASDIKDIIQVRAETERLRMSNLIRAINTIAKAVNEDDKESFKRLTDAKTEFDTREEIAEKLLQKISSEDAKVFAERAIAAKRVSSDMEKSLEQFITRLESIEAFKTGFSPASEEPTLADKVTSAEFHAFASYVVLVRKTKEYLPQLSSGEFGSKELPLKLSESEAKELASKLAQNLGSDSFEVLLARLKDETRSREEEQFILSLSKQLFKDTIDSLERAPDLLKKAEAERMEKVRKEFKDSGYRL